MNHITRVFVCFIMALSVSGCISTTENQQERQNVATTSDCPADLKDTTILSTTKFAFDTRGYYGYKILEEFELGDIGENFSSLFTGGQCKFGENAGENLNSYYCYLAIPCHQVSENGVIKGYEKTLFAIEYDIIDKQPWTDNRNESHYNMSLSVSNCVKRTINEPTQTECMLPFL